MSAWARPVCGRAGARLSIFTPSTGPSDFTGSPVNGDSNCPPASGLMVGPGTEGAARPRMTRNPASTKTPTVRTPSTASTLLRRYQPTTPPQPAGAHGKPGQGRPGQLHPLLLLCPY